MLLQLIRKEKSHCQIQHSHEPGLTIIHVKLINDTDGMIQISRQYCEDEWGVPTLDIEGWIEKMSLQTFVYHFIDGFGDMLVECGTYQEFLKRWNYPFKINRLKAIIKWISYFNPKVKLMKLQKVEYLTCGLEMDPIMHLVKKRDQNGCWMLNHRLLIWMTLMPQYNNTLLLNKYSFKLTYCIQHGFVSCIFFQSLTWPMHA